MRKITFFSLFFICIHLKAQPSLGSIPNIDSIYDAEIMKSLNFNDGVHTVSMPIIYNNLPYILNMEFDFLEGSPRRLYYTFKYCEKDWKDSPIDPLEIMQGVNEVEINQFQTSFNTYTSYVHYRITLPSSQIKFRQTGNYLIIIYDQDGQIYCTRRIFYAGTQFSANLTFIQPVNASFINSHQSINILLNTGNKTVLIPREEIQMEIYQNGNPLSKQVLSEPLFFSGNILRYTKDDEILFKAGKEFRSANVRSLQNKSINVRFWDERKGEFHCFLKDDIIRADKNYIFNIDYNGKMVYTSPDVPANTANTRSEYFYLHFKLNSPEKLDREVYVYGLISNWRIHEEYKMTYDEIEKAYKATIYCKNAFIDYAFATLDDKNNIDLSYIEGDWSETENDYFVLVYYRPYGGRFDNLMMATKYNSNRS
ncbi:MAG: DUF5103 domain-containing protein [Saprospiraceae bacterium]|nr:DUF5103 domain-containing protein [Saprospiraceae bacterium]